jgi:hypothetical protein
LLEIVGKQQEKGILQTKLSEATGIDPRSLYYHLNKLEAASLMYPFISSPLSRFLPYLLLLPFILIVLM